MIGGRLALTAARLRLGLETADSIRALGVDLLAAGNDDALTLAIADDLDVDELNPIFEKLCHDLGHPLPTLEQARRTVTRAILQDIIDGNVAPEAGLGHLVRDVTPWQDEQIGAYVGSSWGLHHLVGAYWSYDDLRDRPTASIDGKHDADAARILDRDVISLARDWLAGDALRAADA